MSNQTKHTPGPWHLNPQGKEIEVWTGTTVVCLCHRNLQGLADAHLIAAAPELLEACKFVEDWVNTFLPHQGPAENKLLETVQAAIAKAEGKVTP